MRFSSKRIRFAHREPTTESLNGLFNKFVKYFFQACGTQLSRSLMEAYSSGEHDVIMNATMPRFSRDTDHDSWFRDYMAVSLLRKSTCLLTGSDDDRKSRAMSVWLDGEVSNKRINSIFSDPLKLGQHASDSELSRVTDITVFNQHVRSIIESIIGVNPPRLEDLPVRFGPGSTSANTGQSVTVADKLLAAPHVTIDALCHIGTIKKSRIWFLTMARFHPSYVYTVTSEGSFVNLKRWSSLNADGEFSIIPEYWDIAPKIVNHDRLAYAPKNAKTFRTIGITAGLNAVFQKQIGTHLGDCLRRAGLGKDLTPLIHRKMAKEASVNAGATIDISNASGTLAYELIRFYFPVKWYTLLAELRSGFTEMPDGQMHENEMFSSMGNGYTFEMETILFYAISRAATDLTSPFEAVSVFGDDIIVPSSSYKHVCSALAFCGFTPNEEKSFNGTGFAESCGGDFLLGKNVRPFFIKEKPCYATDIYTLVNGLYRVVKNYANISPFDDRYLRAWLRIVRDIPKEWRYQGPPGYGDQWIVTDQRQHWTKSFKFGLTKIRGLTAVPQWRGWDRYGNDPDLVMACALYGVRNDDPSGKKAFNLRGDRIRTKVKWFPVVDDGFPYREIEESLTLVASGDAILTSSTLAKSPLAVVPAECGDPT